ncbi:hypothetical protein ACFL5R_01725 [Pseudomonadota bacterium]
MSVMNLCFLHLKGYRLIEKQLIERMESSGVIGLTLSNSMVFPYLTEQGIRSSSFMVWLYIKLTKACLTNYNTPQCYFFSPVIQIPSSNKNAENGSVGIKLFCFAANNIINIRAVSMAS